MSEEIWKNNYGEEIHLSQLEQLSDEVAAGNFTKWKPVSEIRYGTIFPTVEKTTVACTIPIEMSKQLNELAIDNNCSVSDLVLSYVTDGILQAKS